MGRLLCNIFHLHKKYEEMDAVYLQRSKGCVVSDSIAKEMLAKVRDRATAMLCCRMRIKQFFCNTWTFSRSFEIPREKDTVPLGALAPLPSIVILLLRTEQIAFWFEPPVP